jgi:hypothetical protein
MNIELNRLDLKKISEFLRKIILADYGNLYNTGVSFLNIQLMFSSNLNNVFETNKDRMAQFLTKDEKSNKCANNSITYCFS